MISGGLPGDNGDTRRFSINGLLLLFAKVDALVIIFTLHKHKKHHSYSFYGVFARKNEMQINCTSFLSINE